MPLTPEQERLQMQLDEDMNQARARTQESADARGVRQDYSSFEPKSIRIKGKSVAQEQLDASKHAINKAVNDLTFQAALADQNEEFGFRSNLKSKFDQMRLEVIKSAAQLDKSLLQRKMSAEQKKALIAAYVNIISGGAAAGVASIPKDKTPSAQANAQQSMQGKTVSRSPASGAAPIVAEDTTTDPMVTEPDEYGQASPRRPA
jgi:hypothetical protein